MLDASDCTAFRLRAATKKKQKKVRHVELSVALPCKITMEILKVWIKLTKTTNERSFLARTWKVEWNGNFQGNNGFQIEVRIILVFLLHLFFEANNDRYHKAWCAAGMNREDHVRVGFSATTTQSNTAKSLLLAPTHQCFKLIIAGVESVCLSAETAEIYGLSLA